jgi:hypothetical protein
MSVDLSGEITPIATAALAFFAVTTAWFVVLAYLKQRAEVGILLRENREHQLALEREGPLSVTASWPRASG